MKKGFTLIELLAVIAILAILVIIAVPRVLSLFNESKEKTFAVESRNIKKAAYQAGGAGAYIGTQRGTWTKQQFLIRYFSNCKEKVKFCFKTLRTKRYML